MRAPIHSPVNTRQIERKTAQRHKDTTKNRKFEQSFLVGDQIRNVKNKELCQEQGGK